MDLLGTGCGSDLTNLGLKSSPKVGEKRSSGEDLVEDLDGLKRTKMQDLECLFHSEALTPRNKTSNFEWANIDERELHQNEGEKISEISETTTSILPDRQGIEKPNSLEKDSACLRLCHVDGVQAFASLGSDAASEDAKTSGSCAVPKGEKACKPSTTMSVGLGLDLNAADLSSMVDHNPFYPYKKLGQIKSVDDSECGSTTGPVEENEPLKMWKKMKQNGFLSSAHGGIPIPKQHVRQSKKRKDDELKKKNETVRKEQANRFAMITAPSGLLSKLNPGIINHVRNSKQVHSIIEAIVRSEKVDGQTQYRASDHVGRGSKGSNENRKLRNYGEGSANNQFSLCLNKPSCLSNSRHRNGCGSEIDDDTLALKLSSTVTMASQNASSASTDNLAANQDAISSLSLKAANVASQWLELLEQDIKGRLAALRRSKKRVRNVIQTELPYLISTEVLSNQENNACFGHYSEAASSMTATQDIHVDRWKSLFNQMDKALCEEGKHLENWLRQVQEMQAHCVKGLRYVGLDGISHLDPSENSRLKSKDALEQESAVRAAAASIYSTSNLILTSENVPCF